MMLAASSSCAASVAAFNDGGEVPEELLGEAVIEVRTRFKAVRYDSQGMEGQWLQKGILYQDELSLIIVDMPDTLKNRQWMKKFKAKKNAQD